MSNKQANEIGYLLMSLLRAIESSLPEDQCLFEDPVSQAMLPWYFKPFLLPGLRQLVVAVTERRGPGAYGNLVCRTRYIDDALLAALSTGLDQVVILGAGFDWRPYRIPGIEHTRVFEVDLPAVQALKRKSLQKQYVKLPAHVSLVPVDFNNQDLAVQLRVAGFDYGRRTFFIWEGVTQYITAQAIDSTFGFISSAADPGSQVVFTYIHRGIIAGTARSKTDEQLFSLAQQGGVPWISGFDPSEVQSYLAERGFEFMEEVWTPGYKDRYLKPIGRQMAIFAGERAALASVIRS
ncbi:MAG: class I SAM-dependent methyltransferase [Anaerolineales bacterium]|nr:class I SAM-dependent methyltransferase [Anaerolineales bacterium]